MKKIFAIALIAVSVAACNNSGKKKEATTETTIKTENTPAQPIDTTPVNTTPAETPKEPAADTTLPH